MYRWTVLVTSVIVIAMIIIGCSGGDSLPVTPTDGQEGLTAGSADTSGQQTHVWGIYDLYFDFENQSVEVVPNHNAMFTANVTTFVNNSPANLGFNIHGTPVEPGYIDVDIDVSITHPFPGLHQYDGYDVRGIFMGAGAATMDYGSGLKYATAGADQEMYDYNPDDTNPAYSDPHDGPVGNPDGYSRWFNASEFTGPGVLGYTPGKLATPDYTDKLTATLNPYKYYCDGIGPEDDLFTWLKTGDNALGNGIFTAGATNTRNYYLRFPLPTPNVSYGYAVIATWGEAPDENPLVENAVESIACSVGITPDIYFASDSDKGGDFIADIDLWQWEYAPSTIYIESSIHSAVESFDPVMNVIGGNENYSTYHVEFTPDSLNGNDAEYWVIAEYGDYDYTCKYPAPAPDETLAAFFRFDLFVADIPYNKDPIVDTGVDGEVNPFILDTETYSVTAHDPDPDDTLTYSWTVSDFSTGDPITGFEDLPGDGMGNIDIDFASLGATDLKEYNIDCVVSDGTVEVPATTLYVICTAIIWEWDGDDDDGSFTQISYGYGVSWQYVDNVWDENGNTSGIYNGDQCRTLMTPEIDIPSGTYTLNFQVYHSGEGPGYAFGPTMYGLGGYIIGYTVDGGSTINFDVAPCSASSLWLSFINGQAPHFPYTYGNLGLINKTCHGCQWYNTWTNRAFSHHNGWGTMADPTYSNYECNPLKGLQDVQLCFNAHSADDYDTPTGTGWQLHSMKFWAEIE